MQSLEEVAKSSRVPVGFEALHLSGTIFDGDTVVEAAQRQAVGAFEDVFTLDYSFKTASCGSLLSLAGLSAKS